MNSIENAWAILKRTLRRYSTYPTSKDTLFERLSEIWDKLPDSYFDSLIGSMPNRVKSLRIAKGLSTQY